MPLLKPDGSPWRIKRTGSTQPGAERALRRIPADSNTPIRPDWSRIPGSRAWRTPSEVASGGAELSRSTLQPFSPSTAASEDAMVLDSSSEDDDEGEEEDANEDEAETDANTDANAEGETDGDVPPEDQSSSSSEYSDEDEFMSDLDGPSSEERHLDTVLTVPVPPSSTAGVVRQPLPGTLAVRSDPMSLLNALNHSSGSAAANAARATEPMKWEPDISEVLSDLPVQAPSWRPDEPPRRPVGLKCTSSGRPYNMYYEHTADGVKEHKGGFPFPENYRRGVIADFPWICPIRSCRRAFQTLDSLNKHWARPHHRCLLNDNGDGTFSILGHYPLDSSMKTPSPAIVISQRPLDPKEPPMVKPVRHGDSAHMRSKAAAAVMNAATKSPPETVEKQPEQTKEAVQPPVFRKGRGDALEAILSARETRQKLFDKPEATPDAERTVPKVEPAPDVDFKPSRYNLKPPQDPMTKCRTCAQSGQYCENGDPSVERPCDTCVRSKFLNNCRWDLAGGRFSYSRAARIFLPPKMARTMTERKSHVYYDDIRRHGGWVPPPNKVTIQLAKGTVPKGAVPKAPVAPTSRKKPVPPAAAAEAATPDPEARCVVTLPVLRRGSRSTAAPATYSTKRPRRTPTASPRPPATAPKPAKLTAADVLKTAKPSGPTSSEPLTLAATTAAPAPGRVLLANPSEFLEMEDWEIAPGRIRAQASDPPENLAFSNAYLTGSQSVAVCDSLTFRVEVVRPGQTEKFAADPDVTRICSIAQGKLCVRLEGEPEFVIGLHGVFKLKPGKSCTVQNRLYVDSFLHVSSLHTE